MVTENKTILTCFAGRQSCMSILLAYVDSLMGKGLIDEFHAWNFTRKQEDEMWLKRVFLNDERYNVIDTYEYTHTGQILTEGKPVTLSISALRDAHVALYPEGETSECCELVLGGWNNTVSVIRHKKQGPSVQAYEGRLFKNAFENVTLTLHANSSVSVTIQGQTILSLQLPIHKTSFEVHIAGWEKEAPVKWKLDTPLLREGYKLFEVDNRCFWTEYYKYYTKERFVNCVIIKCDDDVVFINPETFGAHIKLRKELRDPLLLFPAIINNDMSLYFLQNLGIMPISAGIPKVEYDPVGFGNGPWRNGEIGEKIHEHFVNHSTDVIERGKQLHSLVYLPKGARISINFFSIRSEDLDVFQQIGTDDELDLTTKMPVVWNRYLAIDLSHVVSHFSFFPQTVTGMNRAKVLEWYDNLSKRVLSK